MIEFQNVRNRVCKVPLITKNEQDAVLYVVCVLKVRLPIERVLYRQILWVAALHTLFQSRLFRVNLTLQTLYCMIGVTMRPCR